MTTRFAGCLMTAKDFDICRAMLAGLDGSDPPLARLLRAKVDGAIVVPVHDIDPRAVTLNSRGEFRIDGGAPQIRILVRNEFQNGLVGLTLPVSALCGLALLGLRQGQACAFDDGERERSLFVDRVLYQPEAARAGGHADRRRPEQPASIIDFQRARETRLRAPRGEDLTSSSSRKKGTRN